MIRLRSVPMNIAVLHNSVASDDSPEDQDTLTQVAAISHALSRLGHQPASLPCTLDLAAVRETLLELDPDVVVNLVESLGGSDSLAHLASALLDALRLPYTGSHTEALFATNHKLIAKRTMRQAGLPTPPWLATHDRAGWTSESVQNTTDSEVHRTLLEPPCIIKSVWEHGSRGLDDENVVREGDTAVIRERLGDFVARTGRPHFAEQFIDGREFNVPMLDGPDGPRVLPPGEIDFSTFPEGKPQIIGHRAKWHESSFEYNNTPRSFHVREPDRHLIECLWRLALECWRVFDLRGYVRVDFRIDRGGQPWILEINANPCLSPDAGFAAALAEAGISYDEAVKRIVDSALSDREAAVEIGI
jgi:D-alanine-D-alanine ligase